VLLEAAVGDVPCRRESGAAAVAHDARPNPSLLPPLPRPRSKALGGGTVDVPSLDNRVLRVPLKEVVRPGYERVVPGEGGPLLPPLPCPLLAVCLAPWGAERASRGNRPAAAA
jgi:hypothetical protein